MERWLASDLRDLKVLTWSDAELEGICGAKLCSGFATKDFVIKIVAAG